MANVVECGPRSSPKPIRGRYLRRGLLNSASAAFTGADLHSGAAVLVEPSLEQCALLVGVSVGEIWHAERRQQYRTDIVAERIPLVPRRPKKSAIVPATSGEEIGLDDIRHFIDRAGAFRVQLMLDHIENMTRLRETGSPVPPVPALAAAE